MHCSHKYIAQQLMVSQENRKSRIIMESKHCGHLLILTYHWSPTTVWSKQECQRILQIAFECGQPSSAYSSINSPVIRAQGHFHDLHRLETPVFFRSRDERRYSATYGEYTWLWWINYGGEVRYGKHSEIWDREGSALIYKVSEVSQKSALIEKLLPDIHEALICPLALSGQGPYSLQRYLPVPSSPRL